MTNETPTVRLRVEATNDQERLMLARAGTSSPILVDVPASSPGISGINEQGMGQLSGSWQGSKYYHDASGRDYASAIVAD